MIAKSIAKIGLAAAACLAGAGPGWAQYAPVDPTPLGNATTSVMANTLSGDIASGGGRSGGAVSSRCLADSGPGPERRAMEAEYRRRLGAAGRVEADSWRAEQGRAYRARLIASGKCPRSAGH